MARDSELHRSNVTQPMVFLLSFLVFLRSQKNVTAATIPKRILPDPLIH